MFYAASPSLVVLGVNPQSWPPSWAIWSRLLLSDPTSSAVWTGSSALEPMVYAAICAALIALVYRVLSGETASRSDPRRHAATRQALVESDARFNAIWMRCRTSSTHGRLTVPSSTSILDGRTMWVLSPSAMRLCCACARRRSERTAGTRNEALRRAQSLRAEFVYVIRGAGLRLFMTRCVPIRDARGSVTGG